MTARLSFDVIWEWGLKTKEGFIGEGFKELFGYTVKKSKSDIITNWVKYMHPDDSEAIAEKLSNTINSKAMHWRQAYRIIRCNATVAKVFVRANILRTPDGKAYRMVGAVHVMLQINSVILRHKNQFAYRLIGSM